MFVGQLDYEEWHEQQRVHELAESVLRPSIEDVADLTSHEEQNL